MQGYITRTGNTVPPDQEQISQEQGTPLNDAGPNPQGLPIAVVEYRLKWYRPKTRLVFYDYTALLLWIDEGTPPDGATIKRPTE